MKNTIEDLSQITGIPKWRIQYALSAHVPESECPAKTFEEAKTVYDGAPAFSASKNIAIQKMWKIYSTK